MHIIKCHASTQIQRMELNAQGVTYHERFLTNYSETPIQQIIVGSLVHKMGTSNFAFILLLQDMFTGVLSLLYSNLLSLFNDMWIHSYTDRSSSIGLNYIFKTIQEDSKLIKPIIHGNAKLSKMLD